MTLAWLLISNLIPLVGVALLGWSLLALLMTYWLENGVIGYYNIKKLQRVPGETRAVPPPFTKIQFFALHYGIFWFVHGVFVLALFGSGALGETGGLGWWGFLGVLAGGYAYFVSHGAAYREEYVGARQYLHTTPARQMFAPYGRVLVLHLTLLGGAFAAAWLGTPLIALVILVTLKLLFDLSVHLRQRQRGAGFVGGR